MGTSMLADVYAANDYSLFDMRVDMISVNFALWSVIETALW